MNWLPFPAKNSPWPPPDRALGSKWVAKLISPCRRIEIDVLVSDRCPY